MCEPLPSSERALRAYRAMQRQFWTRRGLYRREGRFHLPGTAAHLWPFIRAFVAVLDLAGIPGIADHFDPAGAIDAHLSALDRYWEPLGPWPAYSSDVAGTRLGGDRYYDDNAWVGLALVQLERMRPGTGRLARAADLYRFAAHGWDRRAGVPAPGGVFWVEQGRGIGRRNHDRNTVSNAPNAQLGLHLAELGAAGDGPASPRDMYAWVNGALTAGAEPGAGLFWDKIRGDDSIDRALWSYNQGSMVGLNVLLARADPATAADHLYRAETIARRGLRHYQDRYDRQPAAFNAIWFRNLLQLHAATADTGLRADIMEAMRRYAERAWCEQRDSHDCFRLAGRPASLLDQSAMTQVLALLAWEPGQYARLA